MIDLELAAVVERAIEDRLIDIHYMLPCTVDKANLSETPPTVEVILDLERVLEKEDGTQVLESLPKLDNVPISIQIGGGKFISLPVKKGDTGRVQFSEADWGQWRELGTKCSPGDVGRFTLSSAIFIPDIVPVIRALAATLTNDLVLGTDLKTQIRCKDDTVEITSNGAVAATDFVALATKVDAMFNLIDSIITAWTPVAQDGGAALKTAWGATYPGSKQLVGSTNLKAD